MAFLFDWPVFEIVSLAFRAYCDSLDGVIGDVRVCVRDRIGTTTTRESFARAITNWLKGERIMATDRQDSE